VIHHEVTVSELNDALLIDLIGQGRDCGAAVPVT
jgi:hypothetical protein